MKKRILIDSLYINQGGGLHLLKYLINELSENRVYFFLLADVRCKSELEGVNNILFLNATLKERKAFYINHKDVFSRVLCFANIPPQIKLDCPVYTYFHNINLLTLEETNGIKAWVKQYLKRFVFRYFKSNTDYWIVQTENTSNELVIHLKEKPYRVLVLPFFELPQELKELPVKMPKNMRNDYVYIGDYYHGAKGHDELLDAWEILYSKGVKKNLHLTIDFSQIEICKRIESMRERGISIINHGTISFRDVIKVYGLSKATVYPSHNESLGLGIIEAITAGCDVIGADLPYMNSICSPSLVFKPYSAASIIDAVLEYEKKSSKESSLMISNHMDEMVRLLTNNELSLK